MKHLKMNNTGEEKLRNIFLSKYYFKNARLRIGILLLIFSFLWYGKKTGLFASDIFGPLVMLTLGLWFIITYFTNQVNNKYNDWISSLNLNQCDYYGL